MTSTANCANAASYGIWISGPLTVNGAAVVSGTSNEGNTQSCGISALSGVTVNDSARVEGHSKDTAFSATSYRYAGIYVGNSLVNVNGGSLLATSSLLLNEGGQYAWALMKSGDADPLYCGADVTAQGSADAMGSGATPYDTNSFTMPWKTYKWVKTTFTPPTVTVTATGGAQFLQGGAAQDATFRVECGGDQRFNATNNFDHATLDGTRLDLGTAGNPGADGSVADGSILLTINNRARLNALDAGDHTLVITLKGSPYTDRTVRGTITVTAPGGIPKTGDDTPVPLLCALIALSGAGLAASAVSRRRKRRNG